MATKLIYFVRHGETENNLLHITQGEKGALTELGREQALATARRFPKGRGRPGIIIASPYERTRETAEIIGRELRVKVKYSDLLKERRNPTEFIGVSKNDPKLRHVMDRIDNSFRDDNYRYSDEENFVDLKKRSRKLLRFIRWQPHKRIILVSHGFFLKMVAAYMTYGDALTASQYNTLSYFNPVQNAGMAIIAYDHHWFKKDEWKILVWNDLA
jgi:broad specificity phosphatase PhoE